MKKLALVFFMLVSFKAFAGYQTGTVNQVGVRASDGLIYLVVNGAKTGSPACAKSQYWMIKDEKSNAGHQQYVMLLAAQASGKKAYVFGTNTCKRFADSEDIDAIHIAD